MWRKFSIFGVEKVLHIWVLNSEDGVKTFKYNEVLEELIDIFSNFLRINFEMIVNRDSSFHDSGFRPGYQSNKQKSS